MAPDAKDLTWRELFEYSKWPLAVCIGALVAFFVFTSALRLLLSIAGLGAAADSLTMLLGILFELAVFGFVGYRAVKQHGLSRGDAQRVAAFTGLLRNSIIFLPIALVLGVIGAGSAKGGDLLSFGVCLPALVIFWILMGALDGGIGGWIGAYLAYRGRVEEKTENGMRAKR